MFWNLAGVDCVSEEVVEKKIVETWVLVKCSFDVAKESDKKFDVKDHISWNLKWKAYKMHSTCS